MTKEEFIKQRMEIDKVTRKYFDKNYIVIECNCGKSYCNGWRCLTESDINDADLFNYIKNLQQRIDKAIEYLKETTFDFGNDEMIFDKCDAYKLLSILQGEDVENNEL